MVGIYFVSYFCFLFIMNIIMLWNVSVFVIEKKIIEGFGLKYERRKKKGIKL